MEGTEALFNQSRGTNFIAGITIIFRAKLMMNVAFYGVLNGRF